MDSIGCYKWSCTLVGPLANPFDGKANLLTNGQIIINETAFHSAFQHQQANTPANNTPRAFLKALFFDEQLNLTDSALIRINRGANTIHTYSGQRTAQQNGYVYVYVTNESSRNVWFDDLFVTHRTGPLLQEAHFYPFGQEITPLSSKALLKTPNDRMLQQNEWDEEFGLDLHDFDARMYDASIGRFWGVDPKADRQFPLSPYHYAANNPYMFADPDGRAILPIALFLGKKLAGKKIAAGIAKAKSKVAKALKFTKVSSNGSTELTKFGKFMKSNFRPIAAGTRNVMNNWDNISSREGSFWSAAMHFGTGFGGAKIAMLGTDPSFNTVTFFSELEFEFLGALSAGAVNFTIDGALGAHDGHGDAALMSFARGAGAVISSKFDEKGFKKGASGGIPEFNIGKFSNGAIASMTGALANNIGKYGLYYGEAYGGGIYWQIALGGLLAGAASGGLDALHFAGIGGDRESFFNSFSMRFMNVAVNSIGKDMLKLSVYHSMNDKFNKKNDYWKTLLTPGGSGLNAGMGIGAFFIRLF